jgi:hypothetical protein
MGFYLRKGFNFGPLRLNLSRSGLGTSFGVTGGRIPGTAKELGGSFDPQSRRCREPNLRLWLSTSFYAGGEDE